MPVKKVQSSKLKVKSEDKKSKVETSRIASAPSKSNIARAQSRTTKSSLSVPVYSLVSAKESGTLDLPKEFFGEKVNKALLAQALRVYMNNQKSHWASTKTRGEVEGSTRKIYKQKGTGRARHGGIRAPLFVGGGIALGPKSRKVLLDLPKKMKQASLISALSEKAKSGEVIGVTGLDKATGKTKEVANLFKKIEIKSALVIVDKKLDSLDRALKNIQNTTLTEVKGLNTYEVIRHKNLIITKEALSLLGEKTNA